MNNKYNFRAAAGVLAVGLSLPASAARAATIFISYGDFFFSPKVVTINLGDTVTHITTPK
jgi:plastocyanin